MKSVLTALIAAAVGCGAVSVSYGQETKPANPGQRGMAQQAAAGLPADWVCPRGGPGLGFGPPPWAGAGRGAAWGGGWGRGAGGGAGWGRGAGGGAGVGRGAGAGGGRGAGWGPGRGAGLGGPFFIDQDGDGVCDHFQQARGVK